MPRTKKSQQEVDATRQEIIGKAASIIAQEGLEQLTARKLAGVLGCSVGSLYSYFASLDDIIRHVNAVELDLLLERLKAQVVQQAADSEAQVLSLADTYMEFSAERGASWAAIFDHRPADEPPDWFIDKRNAPFELVAKTLSGTIGGRGALSAQALWAALYGVEALARAGHIDRVFASSARELAHELVTGYLRGVRS